MLISQKSNFIFIHIYKTGGISVKNALKKYDDRNFWLKLLDTSIVRQIPYIKNLNPLKFHGRARDIKNYLGEKIYRNYFTFAFVRNPWSWQVSLFHYTRQFRWHYQRKIARGMNFKEYIEWRIKPENLKLQKDFLTDDKGKIIVDFIGRVENMKKDFKKITNIIGVDEKIEHKNRSQHEYYKQYYTQYTKKLIADFFYDDIKLFDYSF